MNIKSKMKGLSIALTILSASILIIYSSHLKVFLYDDISDFLRPLLLLILSASIVGFIVWLSEEAKEAGKKRPLELEISKNCIFIKHVDGKVCAVEQPFSSDYALIENHQEFGRALQKCIQNVMPSKLLNVAPHILVTKCPEVSLLEMSAIIHVMAGSNILGATWNVRPMRGDDSASDLELSQLSEYAPAKATS